MPRSTLGEAKNRKGDKFLSKTYIKMINEYNSWIWYNILNMELMARVHKRKYKAYDWLTKPLWDRFKMICCIYNKTTQQSKRMIKKDKHAVQCQRRQNKQWVYETRNHKQLWIYGWSVYTVPDCKMGSETNIVSIKEKKKEKKGRGGREREVNS